MCSGRQSLPYRLRQKTEFVTVEQNPAEVSDTVRRGGGSGDDFLAFFHFFRSWIASEDFEVGELDSFGGVRIFANYKLRDGFQVADAGGFVRDAAVEHHQGLTHRGAVIPQISEVGPVWLAEDAEEMPLGSRRLHAK